MVRYTVTVEFDETRVDEDFVEESFVVQLEPLFDETTFSITVEKQ